MTNTEKQIMEKSNPLVKGHKYNAIFKKEMTEYFQKKGYCVVEEDFAFHNRGSKTPIVCQFGTKEARAEGAWPLEQVTIYNALDTEAFKEWKKNDLTLFQTLKKHNEVCKPAKYGRNNKAISFKEFLTEIKNYCKKHEMYQGKKHIFQLEIKCKDVVEPYNKTIDIENLYHKKDLFLDIASNGYNQILYDIIKDLPNSDVDIFDIYVIPDFSSDKKQLIGGAITLSKNNTVYIVEVDTVGYSDIVFKGKKNTKTHINDFSSFEEIYNQLMNKISEHFPDSELLDITQNPFSYMDTLESFYATMNNVVELEQDERDEI